MNFTIKHADKMTGCDTPSNGFD